MNTEFNNLSAQETAEIKLQELMHKTKMLFESNDTLGAMQLLENCPFREDFFKNSLIDLRKVQPIIYVIGRFIDFLDNDTIAEEFLLNAIEIKSQNSNYVVYIPVLANLYLKQKRYEDALKWAEKSLAQFYNNIFTQEILIKAQKALNILKEDYGDTTGKVCLRPFLHYEITPDGKALTCCSNYLPYDIGDYNEGTLDDIWNSDAAQKIRESILDGSYKYCSKLACPLISSNRLEDIGKVESGETPVDPLVKHAIVNKQVYLDHTPLFVNLSHDRSCNLACPSCRKDLYIAKSDERKKLDRIKDTIILPALKGAKRAHITGSGDPFGSKHFREILGDLDNKDYADLKITLQTNGVLCTPEEWSKLAPIHSLIDSLYISIDAATAETYDKVRIGGDFNKLLTNLDNLATLKKDGKLQLFNIAFVVQNDNYLEMEEFVRLGVNWGVDNVVFTRIRQWGTFTEQEFMEHNIFAHDHPNYNKLQNILKKDIFKHPSVHLGNL